MSNKIPVHYNKTLKLLNVLLIELSKEKELEEFQGLPTLIEQMDLHIRLKGAQPIGPLIQKTSMNVAENGEPQMLITFIRQSDTFIHHINAPYKMESVMRETNCLYTRFIGDEDKIHFAYNKLQLVGYEEEIPLSTTTYTVFVDANEDEGTITADIFVPKL